MDWSRTVKRTWQWAVSGAWRCNYVGHNTHLTEPVIRYVYQGVFSSADMSFLRWKEGKFKVKGLLFVRKYCWHFAAKPNPICALHEFLFGTKPFLFTYPFYKCTASCKDQRTHTLPCLPNSTWHRTHTRGLCAWPSLQLWEVWFCLPNQVESSRSAVRVDSMHPRFHGIPWVSTTHS